MRFLKSLNLEDLLFIDIEAVNLVKNLNEDPELYKSWEYKMKNGKNIEEEDLPTTYNKNGALYPEFAKVVSIVIAKVHKGKIHLKAFQNTNEKELLEEFFATLNNITSTNKNIRLAGHNIKIYDIPFLLTRSIVNQVEPPALIDIGHLKPWEQTSVDTHDLWKASSLRGASLLNIAIALGIPSPKEEMAGHETTKYYYEDVNNLNKITEYCKRDVVTTVHIVNACRFEPFLEVEASSLKEKETKLLDKYYANKTLSKEEESILKKELKALKGEDAAIANEILTIITNEK